MIWEEESNMSQGNPSNLRFSLEESVWFQKGQEVSQLLSISLDPNITIQDSEQYVTIQGALELTGEYHRDESTEDSMNEPPSTLRFIQSVEEREEGVCEFTHYFPVDITIPNNRIERLDDIDVQVESFDYMFPERSCMKLHANLTISGLYGDQQHVAYTEDENNVLELDTVERSTVQDQEEEEEDTSREEEQTEINFSLPEENEKGEDVFVAEAKQEPEVVEEEPVLNRSLPILEPQEEEPIDMPEVSFIANRYEEKKQEAEEIFEVKQVEETKPVQELEEVTDELESSSEEVKPQKKKVKGKKSMSLTEFFARKEDEEQLTKVKVCIVQPNDTIDLISERYDVTPQTLMRANQLELNQEVHEGQVLYIPVAVTN